MLKFTAGSEVRIIRDGFKRNVGKQVRLVHWVKPGEAYEAKEGFVFKAEDLGFWIVKPVDGSGLILKRSDGVTFISNFGIYQEEDLDSIPGVTFISLNDPVINPETMETIILSEEAWDKLHEVLESNKGPSQKLIDLMRKHKQRNPPKE